MVQCSGEERARRWRLPTAVLSYAYKGGIALALLTLAACAPQTVTRPASLAATPAPSEKSHGAPTNEAARAAPEAPSSQSLGARAPVHAKKFMIVAANPYAAKAGRDILARGGSAVDAAIAAQMVLNVVEPQSSGIGGGAFMLHFNAADGDIAAYDGRETAPRAATPDMFLDAHGAPRKFYDAAVGGLSVGVPGVLRMLEMAYREHGKLPWKSLFQPAIDLARKGFPVSPRLHELIARDKYLKTFAPAAKLFYDAAGAPLAVGATFTNPELADTLSEIANKGVDAFYLGQIGGDIVHAVRTASRNPGRLGSSDMVAYRAIKRAPVCAPYRKWLVCGMGPPSSGGITTAEILGIVSHFDLAKEGGMTVKAAHWIAEASARAFADRNTYIADPKFVPVPQEGLLDPAYLKARANEIGPRASVTPVAPGMPAMSTALNLSPSANAQGASTTHLSVVDGDGNAVSMTSSIENAFGSRLMVRGFLLNNQLTDFSFRPAIDGVPVANQVKPRKRPRSSMAPTLVFDAAGRLVMALGSPGGSRIIGYVSEALIAYLDWRMNVQQAVSLPHVVDRNGPIELEAGTPLTALKAPLEALGHKVVVKTMTSGLHAIAQGADGLSGGADPRREGVALGE